jgi:integrase/recombinase XerD
VGFEPTRARRAHRLSRPYGTESPDERIENFENMRILRDFKDYLTIDRQLEEGTVRRHLQEVKRLFNMADFNPLKATRSDIRAYLANFIDRPANTYANILKTLRVFYRDYLERREVIEGFKFPNRPFNRIAVPSKRELQEFYRRLREPLAKAIFLIYATTGLRRREVLNLRIGDIDFDRRMIIPKGSSSRTKKTWITFYNGEAEEALRECLGSFKGLNKRVKLFPVGETYFRERYKAFERETGIKITPQILREWFACEMGRLGVPDRYVDAFCGRVPKSVLARHYTDFSPEKLKEIYEKANLKVLS